MEHHSAADRESEHTLACLSSSPSNAKIIRTAARMASAFGGSFTALYVKTPDSDRMEEADKNAWNITSGWRRRAARPSPPFTATTFLSRLRNLPASPG